MRGLKVKALRRKYVVWLEGIVPFVKGGYRPISFRVWRRKAVAK